ncbi:MAG: hypothetical protein JW716_01205 [Candidatus Aenigmarchaeota archaeon]|nr:hypothetical protein [Candidatus Aenigmarchaeota archaeon]
MICVYPKRLPGQEVFHNGEPYRVLAVFYTLGKDKEQFHYHQVGMHFSRKPRFVYRLESTGSGDRTFRDITESYLFRKR